MRNTKTREGFEFWDKLNGLPRYAFLLSPSGKSVQKFEDQAMGSWIDVHEAQKVVDQAQEVISELRDELATWPKPDSVLCKFYDVTDWPGLVRELVGHVAQLQDSAKRNVKPWEDTFPPTLLPAYIERVNAANATAQPQGVPVMGKCAQDVYANGRSVCLVDIPKETAETICRNVSAVTGCKVDWHYIGGRVHIKALSAEQPAPSYRLLGDGDIIQDGDETLNDDTATWGKVPVGVFIGMPYNRRVMLPVRRATS